MILNDGVRIRVPASTANLGPGFDTLGMALSLYAWIEMRPHDRTVFELHGDEMKGLPQNKDNLLYKVAQLVFQEAGISIPELHIGMYSDIPLTRGLGSSASAIVGALAAANAVAGSPLPDHKLFDMATDLERHPDNVGASMFGGIIASAWDGQHADYVRIEPPEELETLVVIPDFQLATTKARDVLPQHVSLTDAVFNISRSSLLTAALSSGQLDLISAAMQDRLHQPYRASLVPGMDRILKEATGRGALGIALSGAGPTMIAFVRRGDEGTEMLKSYLLETMKEQGIQASAQLLKPDKEGVTVLGMNRGTTLMDIVKGEVTI
ncbi:homoserine kinase [Paenibacillus algicola]|uniref:Homoserine kinase n=1 Tax=Paenibacillus algicola TaxID=2565926 RepID=A0A4P8XIF9_9BACL|nr:homoserine kinase [Paenibacillus algicola]QCT01993.1 homoserine kinase [Paenibacillus algicola]